MSHGDLDGAQTLCLFRVLRAGEYKRQLTACSASLRSPCSVRWRGLQLIWSFNHVGWRMNGQALQKVPDAHW